MSKMTFKTFLEKHMNCDSDYIFEMSQFKKSSPELYQKYSDRIRKVEDFHMQNASRDDKSFWKPLTVETFYTAEKQYNALCKLTGRECTDTTE